MIEKIIFYTHIARAFRTTLIGHLYEICQVYPTVLLSEKLDPETEEALKDKELFPKLEKIIPVGQFVKEKRNLLSKNRYLFQLAKKIIEEYRPNIVITATDMYPFEMYLLRFSKKINSLNIAIQPSSVARSKIIEKWVDLINSYLRFPSFLPFWLRYFLVKCRKYFGHFLYYWILPLTVGEKPFYGKPSHILRKGASGMRDADYQIVFSKRDYDIYLKNGVPAEKLYILSHPLTRKTREFFERVYFNEFKRNRKNKNIVTLMLPSQVEFGFKRKDHSLISVKERKKIWIETINLINQILPEWEMYIKPHPDTKDFNQLKIEFESISKNIKIVNPTESVDKYIEICDVIIGLPLSASTALFTTSLQCPEKPIISLDFFQEILGDCYKNFDGIEYIDNKQKFKEILELIRDNKYQKSLSQIKKQLEAKEFSNAIEMVEFLLQKKQINEK